MDAARAQNKCFLNVHKNQHLGVARDVWVTLLNVQLEAIFDDEAPGAEPARVRPLARVNAQVRLQVSRLGELLAALLTAERPLARVDAHVDLQVLRRGVRLVAEGARETLPSASRARLPVAELRPPCLVPV